MATTFPLPPKWEKRGWKLKIRDRERVEPHMLPCYIKRIAGGSASARNRSSIGSLIPIGCPVTS